MSKRKKERWPMLTKHEIGILPGGFVIHYSFCWCQKIASGKHRANSRVVSS